MFSGSIDVHDVHCSHHDLRKQERMTEHKTLSQTRQRPRFGLEEQAHIKRGNEAVVRVCIIGFSVAIAGIAPVMWGWKIALFLAIIFLVGIVMPAIGARSAKSKLTTTGHITERPRSMN
jgi:hypothetical protein